MTTSDDAYVRGFLAGDGACLRQIDAWIREVLGSRRLGLGPDAADLAQDVRQRLVKALGNGRFHGASTLRTYVWRVSQHAAIDWLRARRSRPAHVSLDDAVEPVDLAPLPDIPLDRDQRRAAFEQVLATLDGDCRRLFQMIAFDELSYAEIAERLGTTVGAVKVRALRCREKAAAIYRSVTSPPSVRLFSIGAKK